MMEMTLICCSKIEVQGSPAILIAVDSVLSAGHRWPYGPKLFPVVGRGDCAIAFEGDTNLAYPLVVNAVNFVRYSDHLNKQTFTDAGSVAMRMTKDIDSAYKGLLAQKLFTRGEWRCSYVFVGWCRLGHPFAWRIGEDDDGTWRYHDLDDAKVEDPYWRQNGCFFAGHGDIDPVRMAKEAYQRGDSSDPLRAYHAFLSVVDDKDETSVGGVPQVALIKAGTCEVIGIREGNSRYLLGHRVESGAAGIRYCQRDLSDLPL